MLYMVSQYSFSSVEKKWQEYWKAHKVFASVEDPSVPPEKRRYVLDMLPYPSAAGLHVGHPEGYTATDIHTRYLLMNGYAVLHPMGFDSFGLPAETYAIRTGTHPRSTTEDNIRRFTRQLESLGFAYDWDRVLSTHDPSFYRWTQWIFLRLFERGLVYEAETPVWYCEALQTVLANEEVLLTEDGPRSERGNHPVVRRQVKQWMMRITAYADRLEKNLDSLDWPDAIKRMQRNWIGRSVGARIRFSIEGQERSFEVFTTRPDTLYGATYVVLAPEHPLVDHIVGDQYRSAIEEYRRACSLKSDLERTDLAKEKTGVFLGAYAINPITKKPIPVWIADYVLANYGTGAIMAVPAHDERDWEFAKQYGLPIQRVVEPADDESNNNAEEPYPGEGVLINSGRFNGLDTIQAGKKITAALAAEHHGEESVQYKMRDWIFSRQRYWGEPIPVLHRKDGSYEQLDDTQLPLELPDIEQYKPSGDGMSPLASVSQWVETTARDGTPAQRETHTMPQWAGSCWYYIRYIDPHNNNEFASREKLDYWLPVDLYVGGAEHAVLHLLYARFWHMVLFDLGLVSCEEPFARLVNQGMILGENGIRMSKSLGNVVNPDDIVQEYGADSLRLYEMFMGPLQQEKPWSTDSIKGIWRFLERIWRMASKVVPADNSDATLYSLLHKTIKKVTEDTERLAYNTAIAQMMIYTNALNKCDTIPRELWDPFVRLLSPYAPHIAEELWSLLGNNPSIARAEWPRYDAEAIKEDIITIAVQVNGKVRSQITVSTDESKQSVLDHAKRALGEFLAGREVKRSIYVPNKIVNFVV